MRYSSQSGGRSVHRLNLRGDGRPMAFKLRRAIAGVGASTLVVGAVLAGPGAAFAIDAEAPAQEQASEVTSSSDELTQTQLQRPTQADADAEKSPAEGEAKSEEGRPAGAAPELAEDTPAEGEVQKAEAGPEDAQSEPDDAAAEPSFDKVYIVQERQYQGGAVDVAYEMAVPDTVKSGDTIQFTFQAPLDYDDSVKPVLRDSEGAVVATGELTDAANRVITFTFTDYVDKNKDVQIAGSFAMIANDPAIVDESTNHEITFTQGDKTFTDTLTIDPHARTPLTRVFNYGVWTGADKGHEKPESAILWTANSPEGQWESMTVEFEPATTSTLVCSTLQFYTQEVPDGDLYHNIENDNEEQRALSGTIDNLPSFVEDVQCSAEKAVVKYQGHVDDNFLYQFTVEASVVDRGAVGHFGSVVRGSNIVSSEGAVVCPDPTWPDSGEYVDFASACELSDTHWYNFVARDASGGEGTGNHRNASISIEKYSTIDGAVQGDYDTTPGKTLKKGESEQITFEITNTGEEALSEIVLVDKTITGPDLKMTECVLESVTLAAGESVTCTGVVTVSEPGQHGDSATVTAIARGDYQVVDTDDWWGVVAPDPVVPPEVPEKPVTGEPEAPKSTKPNGSLAVTGGDAPWLMSGVAVLLLAVGGAAYGIARKRVTQR